MIRETFKSYSRGESDLSIQSLFLDHSNRLWVGCSSGEIFYLQEDSLILFESLSLSVAVTDFCEDSLYNLWIGTEGEGVYVVNDGRNLIQKPSYLNKPGQRHINSIIFHNHQMHVATNRGILVSRVNDEFPIDNGSLTQFDEKIFSNKTVRELYVDRNGVFWVGTTDAGLFKQEDSYWKQYTFDPSDPNTILSDFVDEVFEDETGVLWIGTNKGLSKFDPAKQFFKHYKKSSNFKLNSNIVWSFCKLPDESLLVGNYKGLNLISPSNKVQNINGKIEGLSSQVNRSILSIYHESNSNTIWLGGRETLYKGDLINGFKKFKYAQNQSQKEGNRIYQIQQNGEDIWLSTKNGLFIIQPDTTLCYNQNNSSLSTNVIQFVLIDSTQYWIGTSKGLFKAQGQANNLEFEFIKTAPLSNTYDPVGSITKQNEFIYVGTYGNGLIQYNENTGQVYRYTEKDGLSNNVVYGILTDEKNQLWLSTNRGLTVYNPKEVSFRNYSEMDGLQSNEFNMGAYLRKGKELYFGGINGFNLILPKEVVGNPHPPNICITNFSLYRGVSNSPLIKNISYTRRIELKYFQNNFSLEFSAMHYSSPENNLYRYKLIGFDESWVYSGHKRYVQYTNLDHGKYEFLIQASNSDGVWSKSEPLVIEIEPPFWRTWWFRILTIGSLVLITYGAIWLRLKLVKSQKENLQKLVDHRTREVLKQKEKLEKANVQLEDEKSRSDELLRNILPQQTVEELQIKGKARARSYRLATVMFTDFKNFTKLSESMRPKELLSVLDEYFIAYDEIIEKYNVEKIKTVGDSYMCVGGIPIRNRSNPIDVVMAALEIQRYNKMIAEVKKANGEIHFDARVGVHTGDLIAGVIGIKRFAYDIWGDTVNVANRMEMTCEVGKVNISGRTYKHIKPYFDCTYRGKIQAKNKGEVDMYYVNQLNPEYSLNGEGEQPTIMFWQFIDLDLFSSIKYRKAEKRILKDLEELPDHLKYHSKAHALDVMGAAEKIGISEGIRGEELFLLKTAALIHDIGFLERYTDNEKLAVEYAKEVLPNYGYHEQHIQIISSLILSTQMPQKPTNKLEEILCDADLDYLGREDFFTISDRLKNELLHQKKIKDEIEWDEIQIGFLKTHRYFTKTAVHLRKEEKKAHLRAVEDRLQEMKKGS